MDVHFFEPILLRRGLWVRRGTFIGELKPGALVTVRPLRDNGVTLVIRDDATPGFSCGLKDSHDFNVVHAVQALS